MFRYSRLKKERNMESRHQNKQYEIVGESDKEWPQIFAIFVVSLSSLTFGLFLAWTSPFLVKIPKDNVNYNITEEQVSYLTIISPISMIISSIFVSNLNDCVGRKPTLILVAIPQIIFWLLTIVAKDIKVFYIARVISGMSDSFFFVTNPMYVGEISSPKIRGTFGNLIMMSVYLGQFLINVIGTYYDVKTTAYICIPLPIIYFFLVLFIPESPYYYIIKDQELKAKKTLRFLKWKQNVEDDYKLLKNDVDRQISETGTWMDLIKIQSNRKALIAGLFLRISQLFTGAAIFNYYTLFILKNSGVTLSAEYCVMVLTGLILIITIFVGFFSDKLGRKKSYMSSVFLCGILLLALSLFFYLDQKTTVDVNCIRWFPIVGMFLYIASVGFGVGIIPTLMLGELFSASIKAKGLSILTITVGLTTFVTNKLFYSVNQMYGIWAPFFIFGICSMLSTVICVYLLPETKGKTLEQIQQDLKQVKF